MNGWEAGLGFPPTDSPPSPVIEGRLISPPIRTRTGRCIPCRSVLYFLEACVSSLHGMVFLRRESGIYVNGLEEVWKWGGRRSSR